MRTTKGAPRFSYLPTKDNEVAVRQQLVQSTYGGGGNSEELFALAVNNQFSGLEDSGYDYASRGFDSAAGTSHTAEQNGTTGFQLNSTNASNEADSSLNMVMNIFHPLSTTFAFSYYGNGQVQDTADDTHVFQCSGYYDADHTDAINNIKFQMASGNITSGQFRLYGIT